MNYDPCAEPQSVTIEQLQQRMLARLHQTPAITVPLHDALDKVLAAPVLARIANPRFDNSMMDGFALDEQAAQAAPDTFTVSGTQLAGQDSVSTIAANSAVRIATGAKLPNGTAAVVMQEQCDYEPGEPPTVTVNEPVTQGQFIRYKSSDIDAGRVLADVGLRVNAPLILLLASQGITSVQVYRAPKVAILSTGDELKEGGQALDSSEIYDANRHYLRARLERAGCEILDLGIVPDQRSAIEQALEQGHQQADLIVTSGAVSVGPADWLKQCVSEMGALWHWRLPIKPGKPIAWGRVEDTPFVGLPGNPLSALVGCELFVLTIIRGMQAQQQVLPEFIKLPLTQSVPATSGRQQFYCAHAQSLDGQLQLLPLPQQGSFALADLAAVNALIRIPANMPETPAGEWVDALLM